MEANRIWHKRFHAKAGVSVESHRARATKSNVYVVGSVRNAGKDSWDGVVLEVRLLDSKGDLLRVCRGHVNGPVRPEQVRDFQVDCQGSGWEPVPRYGKYTIAIVDARYELDEGT
ncbi:MAG: FxLYD domain-containing protein [Terriglobia bacterium]